MGALPIARAPAATLSASQIAALLGLPAPTDEQAAVIEAPLGPVLVVAGAGSGKTETMAARVLWLVAGGHAQPEQILGLTFTRKAAGELAGRIRRRLAALRERLGPGDDRYAALMSAEPAVSTYHSYAARLVDEHGLRLGIEPASRVIGPAVCWQYADRLVSSYAGDMDRISQGSAHVASAVLSLSGELAEHLLSIEDLQVWTERFCTAVDALPRLDKRLGPYDKVKDILAVQRARLQLLPLVEAYAAHKQARSELDFGDQVALAAKLAAEVPEVGAAERRRHPIVLLDEYQDTGTAQRLLLSSLFGGGHPVMAVGDPCQSIYGWRGASAGNLTRFPEEFRRDDGGPAQRSALTISWRNGAAVLDLANFLSVALRAEGVEVDELRAAPGAPAGEVRCSLHETPREEADWVAHAIAAQWQTTGEDRPTVAVLCRKRTEFGPVADALAARGVPVEVVGLGGLLVEPEVSDVVATLRVLSDPSAGPALARLLTGPRWRIGPRDLVALGERARWLAHHARYDAGSRQENQDAGGAPSQPSPGELPDADGRRPPPDETDAASLVDALDDLGSRAHYSTDGWSRLVRLRDELRALRQRIDQPLPDLLADIERTTLLEIEVAVHSAHPPAQARVNLDRFLDVAAEFDGADDRATVTAFLAYLDAAEAQERGLEPGAVDVVTDRVQVLTVHAAKGLEWDVVAVVGLAQGVFPDSRGADSWMGALGALPTALRGDRSDLPQLELTATHHKALEEDRKRYHAEMRARDLVEEQRLAYVAVTRARRLVLASGFWWSPGNKNRRGPSSLLQAVASWCRATGRGRVEHWAAEPADGAVNPLAEHRATVSWPVDPVAARRAVLEQAAADVRHALAAGPPDATDPSEGTAAWLAEAELLLAERHEQRRGGDVDVVLPGHLSVSSLVVLRRDPAQLARQLRRPVPFKPAPLARRGTAFHAWLAERFHAQRLLDVDELPGAADEGAAPDADLATLKGAFLASQWGERRPYDVEVPFEAEVAGVLVRGRMDAVFRGQREPVQESLFDGELPDAPEYDVVDWKTGAVPRGTDAQTAAVQLATYRLAWADLHTGGDLSQVSAAFHYVRSGTTVRPVDLLERTGLEALIAGLPEVG